MPLRDVNEHRRYRVEIFWCAESKGFIAVAPDIKGAIVVGASRGSAADMIGAIIDSYLQHAHAVDDPIPEPTRSPADVKRRP